ncbi:unnamed protein product [Macrosiphum euphorbiae]|uniref:MCM N-terminal domain-containing protein n=1 Tax=Macrosiphum euphorbiae TaxID=13131 RepID=A0AAV0WQB2_9HEMI|nr:unnamed protein product [Macrosiphum euphorbiae]
MEEYKDFLEREYGASVQRMILNNDRRVIIDLSKISYHLPNKKLLLLHQFREEEALLRLALKKVVESCDHEYANLHEEFFVGFDGCFGSHHVTPRTLKNFYLNKLVNVEGIVSRCDVVRSKLVKSVSIHPTTCQIKIVH